jgi:hypothetical protein
MNARPEKDKLINIVGINRISPSKSHANARWPTEARRSDSMEKSDNGGGGG